MKRALFVTIISALFFIGCGGGGETNLKVTTEELSANIDPVCQMSLENHIADTVHYKGKIYGFCSSGCKKAFEEEPEKYLGEME